MASNIADARDHLLRSNAARDRGAFELAARHAYRSSAALSRESLDCFKVGRLEKAKELSWLRRRIEDRGVRLSQKACSW
ncbi:MAG: hypothetical protein KGH69_02945 [Candidatus Micrarchaeota archaeon]|nr:hypothetical protein [Candidatus Micrarchaeota archaeon]MDE1851619.1 hypothetical protein [Candidatus Micrarchaeota archaeon]